VVNTEEKQIMKQCTGCDTTKPFDMFSKNKNYRDGLQNQCKQCYADRRKANREKYEATNKAWIEKNRDRINEMARKKWATDENYKKQKTARTRKYDQNNPDKVRERNVRYRLANPEKKYESQRNWRQNNRGYVNSLTRARQAAMQQRTPKWVGNIDMEKIKQKYHLAQMKTEQTGEKWVVDHIIPLRGGIVSGLHVPANLRVIKESTNLRKSNKFDMEKEWRI
jgi:hypothetical protein